MRRKKNITGNETCCLMRLTRLNFLPGLSAATITGPLSTSLIPQDTQLYAHSLVMASTTDFTFSALPLGRGGEDLAPPNQNKRSRANDLLFNKTMAAQITDAESADPIRTPPFGSDSYVALLLNPLSHYGKAVVEDFEITEEDYTIAPGNIGQNICFSQWIKNKLDIEWRCAVIVKLMGKPNVNNAYTFMYSGLKRKWNPQGPWQLIDLPNDFFIVKFHLESDFNIALCGGP